MDQSAILTAPAAELPAWAAQQINLADPRLGAETIACSDDFFAPMTRLLQPQPAIFVPGKYDANGKWMDGWESRRKRGPGHDWCVVRLARPARLAGVDIDTSFFTGNYPPAAALDGCPEGRDPALAESWLPLLLPTPLGGNQHHLIALDSPLCISHVRLNILPDGGVARLRVYGRPAGAPTLAGDGLVDLAAALNGGYPVAWNDAHFGVAGNLLLPGRGVDMGEGWETRRRREPGFDWCIIALGQPGTIRRIELDTAHFKGNFPDRCSLQAGHAPGQSEQALVAQAQFWPTLLPEMKLQADHVHVFSDELATLGHVTHVRLNLHPDGGVSRLRLWGEVARR
ncbi:allantoicase [Rhodocyclus tenuis]|uniref:allantoicase n=1 Tax=Rhodocyclus tenuis TaxID=1066 RepID=UPI0019034C2E|nr:allantoicase [Rhodocyclus tenuis]MBK1681276.1 allantoicase [Rhodocyclus tenuis]